MTRGSGCDLVGLGSGVERKPFVGTEPHECLSVNAGIALQEVPVDLVDQVFGRVPPPAQRFAAENLRDGRVFATPGPQRKSTEHRRDAMPPERLIARPSL